MSIINEALKKALKEKTSVVGASPIHESLRKKFELEFDKNKSSINWGPIFVILVLLLITGPIIAPFFSTPFKRIDSPIPLTSSLPKMQIANLPATNTDSNRKSQFAVEESALFHQSQAPIVQMPYLNLTGIMYTSKNDSYCIINNQILSLGQSIRGAKIVSISSNEVLLEHNGQTIRLFVAV